MAKKQRFRIVLEPRPRSDTPWIVVPFSVEEAFGTRARVAVRGTINGYPFRSSLFPHGDGRHYLVINQAMRTGGKVKAGDTATFVMERDDEPRTIAVPDDFAAALKASPAAQATWERLSYSHHREYVGAIVEAKKPETRARRIAQAIERLAKMSK